MLNSIEPQKSPVFLSLVLRFFIAIAIGVAILGLWGGVFWYNTYRSWSDFTLQRTEVTEHIKSIYEFRKEHNRWAKDMDEVGITLPPHWEYRYYEEDDQPFLFLGGRLRLRFQFEEESKGNGEWNFYVDGDRMQWSKITRPLPSDPKPQVK